MAKGPRPAKSGLLPIADLLVGYHGEPKGNLFHNIRIIYGLYYPKRLKVTYSTTSQNSMVSEHKATQMTTSLRVLGFRA